MRIRHLHLQTERPPLGDFAITFRREAALGDQPLTLHFLIGLNGTGKTRLIQALTETFLALDRDNAPPSFPIWLAYDRRLDGELRTLYLRHPPVPDWQLEGGELETDQHKTALVVFETCLPADIDWDELAMITPSEDAYNEYLEQHFTESVHRVRSVFLNNLPGSGAIEAFLPNPLIVYTSGNTADWINIFAPRLSDEPEALEFVTPEDERPLDWDIVREGDYLRREGRTEEIERLKSLPPEDMASRLIPPKFAYFVSTKQLPLVFTSVILESFIYPPHGENNNFLKMLGEVEWGWPVTLTLNLNFQPERWAGRAALLHDLIILANDIRRSPEPGETRHLVFDLQSLTRQERLFSNKRIAPGVKIAQSLFDLLADGKNAFSVFNTLRQLQQNGLLLDTRLSLRKSSEKDTDVLLFDWLSDGERMLLGRMALFLLLTDEDDALLILDEPETHFNDAWKRDVVDIIERALEQTHSHVLLTSHATLLVTDAFSDEVILFTRAGPRRVIRTLGAETSELTEAFYNEQGVGQRAVRRIQKALDLGDKISLEAMLNNVGPGYYRFALIEKLHDVSPD
jgi:hypothetical protein